MRASGTDAPWSAHPIGVRVYPRWMRPALALGRVVAAINWVGAAVLIARAAAFERVALPPPGFMLEIILVSVIPVTIATLLSRRARGEAVAGPAVLTLTTARRLVEVPLESISNVRVWRVPLPGPGVSLRMRSGQPFPWAVESDDPGALAGVAAGTSEEPSSGDAAGARWAVARHRHRRGTVEQVVRWTVLPLAVAAVLFRADELIRYGDPLGAWHVRGPAVALRAFAAYLIASLASLVVLAAVARTAGELTCAAWTAVSPQHARVARAAAEWMSRFAVYVVPPTLLAIRFFG